MDERVLTFRSLFCDTSLSIVPTVKDTMHYKSDSFTLSGRFVLSVRIWAHAPGGFVHVRVVELNGV